MFEVEAEWCFGVSGSEQLSHAWPPGQSSSGDFKIIEA